MFTKRLAALQIAIEKRREALRKLRWLRPVLFVVDFILLVIDLFLPIFRILRLLLGIGSIAANEFFTPVIIRRIFIKDMEARVPSSGDLQRRHFRPLRLDENVLAQHKQLFDYSCIPMSVEFVLKFLGKLPPGDFPFQENWGNRRDGSFSDFDGWTFDDVKFTRRFSHPRNNGFPLDDLFSTIENELASGRYGLFHLQCRHSRIRAKPITTIMSSGIDYQMANLKPLQSVRLCESIMSGRECAT
jgi:hypothetical protein